MSRTTDDKEKTRKPPRAAGTGGIYKPKGSRFYWISYHSGGKRHFEGTGSEKKGDAQALLTDRLGDTGKGIVVSPKLGKLTLIEALTAVHNNLTMNGRKSAADWKRRYEVHIIKHVAEGDEPAGGYFRAERRMNSITTNDLTAYVTHRLAEGAAAATINQELAGVRRAFRLAVRGGELVTMPYVPMLALSNARKGFFERAELDAVLAHLPDWAKPPIRFAYVTGWRVNSEILPLQASQVDLQAGVVRLKVGTTKNRDGRTFYVTEELRKLLKVQLAAIDALKDAGTICPYIFHKPDGTQIKSLRDAWEKARKDAGYPTKILHDFRRTAVRNLERAGVPRSTAMAAVGHKTESIYRRYAIVDEQMHREAAAKLDAWHVEQQAKAKAAKGQLKRFKNRQLISRGRAS